MAVHQTVDKNGHTRIFNNGREEIEMVDTKGEWYADRQLIIVPKERIMATVHNMTMDGTGKEEALANAHLMAAAPDMYEALKMVTARMESLYDTVLGYEDAIEEEDVYLTQVARDMAEQALAKAEGK